MGARRGQTAKKPTGGKLPVGFLNWLNGFRNR